MIEFVYNTKFSLSDEKNVTDWLLFVTKSEGIALDKLLYNYVAPETIKEINKKHLQHDYVTDIITFNYAPDSSVSAEAFICQDQVLKNAKKHSQTIENETLRVLCHAVLHLSGYQDKTENEIEIMRAKEDDYLDVFNKKFK